MVLSNLIHKHSNCVNILAKTCKVYTCSGSSYNQLTTIHPCFIVITFDLIFAFFVVICTLLVYLCTPSYYKLLSAVILSL